MNELNTKQKYKAFISYSHEDEKTASWLVRVLESYKLPKHITTDKTPKNSNYNLSPIFIDREELNISSDLTSVVRHALKNSEFLIVICSPASSSSKWVNQEIREFIKAHGIEKILCVISSGEPDRNHINSCFPPALFVDANSKYEPAAADLRPNKDGKQLVKLKLISSLLDLKLNQLIQREEKRRQENILNLSLIAITLIVVMGYLTFMANRAKDLAVERLNQTENLIEFMLTDLKTKLQPVGRLDVLSSVAQKVITHYETQNFELLNDHSLGLYARSFHLLGKIERDLGNLDKAQEFFIEAMNSTDQLYARHPNDEQHIFNHAQSAFLMGSISRTKENYLEVEKYWQLYETLSEKLVELNPHEIKWQIEVADAATSIGVLFLEHLERPNDAQKRFEKSLDIMQRLLPSLPQTTNTIYSLTNKHAWLADSLLRTGLISEARQHREDQAAIYDNWLTTKPDDYFIQSHQLGVQLALGILELGQGNLEQARVRLSHNIVAAEALVSHDPENMSWLKQAGLIYSTMLQIQYLNGDIEGYEQTLLRMGEIEEILRENDILSSVTQTIMIHKPKLISARNHFINRNYQLAKVELNQILDAYKDYDNLTSQNNISALIINIKTLLARIEIKLGNYENAHKIGRELVGILEPNINTLTPWHLKNLVIAYYSSGNSAEAIRLIKLLFSRGFAHPEMVRFCEDELRSVSNEVTCSTHQ